MPLRILDQLAQLRRLSLFDKAELFKSETRRSARCKPKLITRVVGIVCLTLMVSPAIGFAGEAWSSNGAAREALLSRLRPEAVASYQQTFSPKQFEDLSLRPPLYSEPKADQIQILTDEMARYQQYSSAGHNENAIKSISAVIDVLSRTFGNDHPETLSYLIEKSRALNNNGNYPEARTLSKYVIEKLTAVAAPEHPLVTSARIEYCIAASGDYLWEMAESECLAATNNSIIALGYRSYLTATALEALHKVSFHTVPEYSDAVFRGVEAATSFSKEVTSVASRIYIIQAEKLLEHHRFVEAESVLSKATILESKRQESNRYTGRIQNNYAVLYVLTGETEKAISILDGLEKEKDLPPEAVIALTLNKAQAYATSGKFDRAKALFRQALSIATANNLPKKRYSVLLAFAGRLVERGEYIEALEIYNSTLNLDLISNPPVCRPFDNDSAQMCSQLGSIYHGLLRYDDAEPFYDAAFAYHQKQKEIVFDYANRLAYLYADTGRLPEGIEQSRYLVANINENRKLPASRGFAPRSLSEFSAGWQNSQDVSYVFGTLIDLLDRNASSETVRKTSAEEVFRALQGATTSQAELSVHLAAAKRRAPSPKASELVEDYQDLTGRLARVTDELADALAVRRETDITNTLTEQQIALRTRIGEVTAELKKAYPSYSALTSPSALSLEIVRDQLAADQALALVMPYNDDNYVFVVTKTGGIEGSGIDWRRIEGGAERTRANVADVLCHVDGRVMCSAGKAGDLSAFDLRAAHGLYRDTLAPFQAQLDASGVKRLDIVASGDLGRLPLSLMVTSAPAAGAALRNASWLGKHYTLTTLPSVSALALAEETRTGGADRAAFVGYGDPLLNATASSRSTEDQSVLSWFVTDKENQPVASRERLMALGRLPGTQTELTAANNTFNQGKPLYLRTAERNREGTFRTDPLTAGAEMLAISTHGLLPSRAGGLREPALVFTPPSIPSPEDDGLLTASEVTQMTLSARWVVLSACDTATSNGTSESLSGLSRAFLFAGAQGLLASHWRIDDAATAELVQLTLATYARARAQGRPITQAQALQTAMNTIRNNADNRYPDKWQHPRYWAPFSIIANGEK